MSKASREKFFWKSHFQITNPDKAPLQVHHLNYRDTEFTDEQLKYLTGRIRRLSGLISIAALLLTKECKFLIQLHEIKELRLKGLDLDDRCIPALQQLQSLELLHLGGTNISCHGIASLTPLRNLKKLLCSPPEILPEQLKKFQKAVPECELIVNYQLWNPEV